MHTKREKSVNVRDIISVIVKRKWLVIVPLIIVTAIAYGVTYFLAPKYQSSTIIWIDRPHNVSRELVSILGRERAGRESGEESRRRLRALQIEITSQTYLHQLIREQGMDQDPEIIRRAARLREENPSFSLEQMKFNLLVDQLRKQVSVSFAGADQIRLTAVCPDPVEARDMVTTLAAILEREKTRYEMERILDNQSFADLQLEKTEFYYQQMIDSLTAAQMRMTQLQLPENISSDSNRRDVLSDIDKAQLELEDYESDRQRLLDELRALGLEQVRVKYTDTIVELRSEIDAQVIRYASLMEKYAWNEQNVINVNIRLNDNLRLLVFAIGEAVDAQFVSYPENQRELLREYFIVEEHLDVLRSRKRQMERSVARVDARINQLPRLQSEISELERRVADARKYRDAFRSEEATVTILSERAKDRVKYRIIEPAKIPLTHFWPDQNKILGMGLMLGLMLGGAAAFLAEIFDNSFKKISDIEEILNLPVLATVPRIDKLKRIRQ
ncbi:MAG: hypothetical protein KOO62_01865 [candidate division Zixibacteria bacterium]|nr:hypothetical protein [candidate division Zixibacteria bacterium]